MSNPKTRIGIYGGSFNPVHKAHIQLGKFAVKKLKLSKIIYVPAFQSPDKLHHRYASGKHRLKMLELSMFDKAEVSNYEIKQKRPVLTCDTIAHFKSLYPKAKLFCIIGSDNLEKIDCWEGIEQISPNAQLVSFKRQNYGNYQNVQKFNVLLLENPILNQSSTSYRKGNLQCVSIIVQKYIGKNCLYLEDFNNKTNEELKAAKVFFNSLNFHDQKHWIKKNLWSQYLIYEYFKKKKNLKVLSDFDFLKKIYFWAKEKYFLNKKVLSLIKEDLDNFQLKIFTIKTN